MEAAALTIPFDAERDSPRLVAAISRRRPDIYERLVALRHDLPADVHCGTHLSGAWFRFPRHYRSFVVPLTVDDAAPFASDVVVFKGAEILLADFPDFLQWMANAQFRRSDLPLALHLPSMLRMPPGAMPLDEAEREQSLATEVQTAHLDAYGDLARLPVPLLIRRIDPESVTLYLQRMSATIPVQLFERIEARARAGLAMSVYYYPSAPIRLDNLLAPVPEEVAAYAAPVLGDPDGLVDRWIRLLARLLVLRYMPFVPWNRGWGACFDAGNACMDGGFTDLVTLTRFATLTDDRLFATSLSMSVEMFADTITTLCRRLSPPFAGRGDNPRAKMHALPFVTTRLAAALRSESAQRSIDPRILDALCPATIPDLVRHSEAILHDLDEYEPRH